MKKIYTKPEMQVTEFISDSVTNINILSGAQTSFKTNSTKIIKSTNVIDF